MDYDTARRNILGSLRLSNADAYAPRNTNYDWLIKNALEKLKTEFGTSSANKLIDELKLEEFGFKKYGE